MKLLICGDRNWGSHLIIREYIKHFNPSLVIEGGARGADKIAGEEAASLGILVKEIPADWSRYGKVAGPLRNKQMLDENPDLVLAFHYDIENSKGTADCLGEAESRGIPYAVIGL